MSKAIKQIKHQLSNANLELDKSRLKMDTPDTDLNIIIEYLQLKDTLNKFSEKVNEAVDMLYLTENSGDTKKKKRKNEKIKAKKDGEFVRSLIPLNIIYMMSWSATQRHAIATMFFTLPSYKKWAHTH